MLAETLKYIYLLFDPDYPIPLEKYVMNTEAHPLGHIPLPPWAEGGGTAAAELPMPGLFAEVRASSAAGKDEACPCCESPGESPGEGGAEASGCQDGAGADDTTWSYPEEAGVSDEADGHAANDAGTVSVEQHEDRPGSGAPAGENAGADRQAKVRKQAQDSSVQTFA